LLEKVLAKNFRNYFHLFSIYTNIYFLVILIYFMEKPVSKLTGENPGTYKASRKKVFWNV